MAGLPRSWELRETQDGNLKRWSKQPPAVEDAVWDHLTPCKTTENSRGIKLKERSLAWRKGDFLIKGEGTGDTPVQKRGRLRIRTTPSTLKRKEYPAVAQAYSGAELGRQRRVNDREKSSNTSLRLRLQSTR
ncbi:hypothetical protein NDU88_002552 [Pleurodeles waltl]|uniref:Uncharacterized protein n=1 Tax=Pleurodeles waltl TaxID=8319 RepID=A0AAV7KWE3_PLEWA|nr:hypothetical protein NDU88_002552 [Pleurodeles waltl]